MKLSKEYLKTKYKSIKEIIPAKVAKGMDWEKKAEVRTIFPINPY